MLSLLKYEVVPNTIGYALLQTGNNLDSTSLCKCCNNLHNTTEYWLNGQSSPPRIGRLGNNLTELGVIG